MYRAFVVTSCGGYGGWFEVSAPTDEAALGAVRLQTTRTPVDVWCGGRFVGRIEHGDVDIGEAGAFPQPRASNAA